MKNKIKIALQKQGRLSEDSIKVLKDAGMVIKNGDNQLKTEVVNFPMEILYLRNSDIPKYLKDGVVDIAILGNNLLVEKGEGVDVVLGLGFSKCRMSLAVPNYFKYNQLEDVQGLKIATSYPNTVSHFFSKKGVEVAIHEISGSVEIAPNIGLSDAIVDIVSSGSTLFKNKLKEVKVLLESEAVLAVSPKISSNAVSILKRLKFRLEAVLRARKSKYILLNIPNKKIDSIKAILPVLKSPTVVPLALEGWSSVHTVIEEDTFWQVIDQLKSAGAKDILVCPIEKMIL